MRRTNKATTKTSDVPVEVKKTICNLRYQGLNSESIAKAVTPLATLTKGQVSAIVAHGTMGSY
jgi:hypothetical protein